MSKAFLIAAVCAAFLILPFHDARAARWHQAHAHRHHAHHVHHHHERIEIGNISGIGGVAFLRGRLVCAINTSRWLKAHGFRAPMSWSSQAIRRYHRVRRQDAAFGDVRFNWRHGGGHNQPVLGWRDGKLWCRDPSSRHQAWVDRVCPAGGEFYRTGRV